MGGVRAGGVRVVIRKAHGQWYAYASGGGRRERNLALVRPINYCRELNKRVAAAGESAAVA